GVGRAYSISGSSMYYAGGGGGGAYTTYAAGAGGLGGGGGGANQSVNGGNGIAGTANTGGGGGGANGNPSGGNGGNGGSGVVIISYTAGAFTATGGTITTVGGKTIHKFTSSGTFNVTALDTPTCPGSATCSVLTEDGLRSSFQVLKPEVDDNGVAVDVSASGKVEILRTSNSAVWRTYSQTLSQSLVGVSDGTYVHAPETGQTNFSSTYGYTGFQPGSCPSGFIPVPGSTLYNKPYGFCVMKYEAKNSGGIPVSTPGGAPWVSIPQSGNFVSQGKSSPSAILTDLSTGTSPYYSPGGAGLQSVTVDLGSIQQVDTIKVWHYWGDGRSYNDTKTEVSTDNSSWFTVFDSAVSGTYIESPAGKTHQFAERPVRYIRDSSNGSSANTANHWVEVAATSPTGTAIDKAADACSGCHLVTENEWLTLAHNVVNQNSNWSGGTVGSGYIYGGHSDGSPANALIASLISDSDNYSGTGQTSGNQRRTLTLSNGEVIWDFAGNVAEWTTGKSLDGQPGALGYAQREWNTVDYLGALPDSVRPDYATPAAVNWTISNGIGSLYSNADMRELRAFWRGGWWGSGSNAGVFYLVMDTEPHGVGTNMGFRVTY
ncbi:MAG TPA: discoidin domain-containing protein, partial [Candidatus Saccharimonadales bacterium]|nr:discoidin domain-containing protein [Candidatus Saccharimonadales bacterium]